MHSSEIALGLLMLVVSPALVGLLIVIVVEMWYEHESPDDV